MPKPPKKNYCRKCGTPIISKGKTRYCSLECRKENRKLRESSQGVEQFLRNKFISLRTRTHRKVLITEEYIQALWVKQTGCCALTGIPMTFTRGVGAVSTNVSIDRIDSNRDYEPNNIQLVCHQANIIKNKLTESELLLWCSRVVAHLTSK